MKFFIAIFVMLASSLVSAKDINCDGLVTWVMDYPERCDGNTAFKTSGSSGKWVCPPSKNGNAIVLAALASNKEIEVYIDNQNGSISCESLPHYVSARYIIINP
jgi:hypothetical protein